VQEDTNYSGLAFSLKQETVKITSGVIHSNYILELLSERGEPSGSSWMDEATLVFRKAIATVLN